MVFLCSRRALSRLCIAVIAVAFIFRAFLISQGASAIAVYVLTPGRMDALAVGALAAVLVRMDGDKSRLARQAGWALGICGVSILFLAVSQGGWEWDNPVVQTIGLTVSALFFGALIVLLVLLPSRSGFARIFSGPVLIMFGIYSYALYLFHLPVRALLRDGFFNAGAFATLGGSQIPLQFIFYVVSTFAALVLAWLSWHAFEKHFLKLKKYFVTSAQSPFVMSSLQTTLPNLESLSDSTVPPHE